MPYRPNFPIPENIDAPLQCIQLCIPNEPTYKSVFAGLIYELTYWFNWERTGSNEGARCAAVWKEIYNTTDWSIMSCCPDNPPDEFRWTDNVYERSTDGGVTWTPAPEYSYQNMSTVFADPADIGVTYTKCQAADSVVVTLKNDLVQAWTEDMVASGILAVVAAVALAVLTAGTSLAITAVATGIGSAVIATGVAAAQAAFTTEVWDRLRCMIFNRMDSNSSIDQAGIDLLYTDVEEFTGVVVPTLKGMIATLGATGFTNIMRGLAGDPDADCTACTTYDVYFVNGTNAPVGVLPDETGHYTVTCDVFSSGGYYGNIQFSTDPPTHGYVPCHEIFIDDYSSGGLSVLQDCYTGTNNPLSHCAALMQWYSASPWVMIFHIGADCS
jgi:hypothetical protein